MLSKSKIDVFKVGIWGIWALHTQFLLLIPFFTFMPRGSWWDGAAFLIALVLYGINLAINYVIAVFWVFRSEDAFADNIALIGLWAILAFASIKLADNLAYYFHFQNADIQEISLSETALEKGNFFLIRHAKIPQELSYETTFSFARTAKGQKTSYEKVNYKITPIVPENWKNEAFFVFAVSNGKENPKTDFKIGGLWHKPRRSEYAEKYPELADSFSQKHQFAKTENPVFLERIDLQAKIAEEARFVAWFYGIVMGVWILVLGVAFGKQK